jgi:CPA2 family monovalent cation:H+ antiporter-2
MAGSMLQNAVIFLGAALICVPVSKKLGIGSVLGYLLAGIIIGPFVLGFIRQEGEDIMHAAEFGVVMMLFLIGLELNPQSFWNMRKSILGMGLSQMLATSVLLFALFCFFLGFSPEASVAISLSMSMSSTAIALQTLKEKGLSNTQAGKASFSVLLLQDIAVIPILAILPLMAKPGRTEAMEHHNFITELPTHYATLVILAAVGLIFLAGRYLVNPFLRLIARVHMRELFTASALFIVVGVAWLMEQVGLSAALGTFMAGVLLANSEYRHELESDIEPFKGLLLGLFFIAVGSTINFTLILESPGRIFSIVLLIMAIKALVLAGIGKVFKLKIDQNILFALLLSQVGEFAFVLLASTRQMGILEKAQSDYLMAAVTISMILSPLLLFINEKFIAPRVGVKEAAPQKEADIIDEQQGVIIAGFGHFGSTVGRFLRANGVKATILDNDSDRVDLLRKMGFKVFYGDATRVDLLESAGAGKARLLISAIDDPERNKELADVVKKHFPQLRIFMRAKNRNDAYELVDMGINHIYRESLHSSVYLGVDVLHELGRRRYTATRKAMDFIRYDQAALEKLSRERHQKDRYILSVKNEIELQERLLSEDQLFADKRSDSAWDSEKRKADS